MCNPAIIRTLQTNRYWFKLDLLIVIANAEVNIAESSRDHDGYVKRNKTAFAKFIETF